MNGMNVHLEMNQRKASYVQQPAVAEIIMVALNVSATTCKTLFHWRLYIPRVLLQLPELTPSSYRSPLALRVR